MASFITPVIAWQRLSFRSCDTGPWTAFSACSSFPSVVRPRTLISVSDTVRLRPRQAINKGFSAESSLQSVVEEVPCLLGLEQMAPRRESIYADEAERRIAQLGEEWGFPASSFVPYIVTGVSFASFTIPSCISADRFTAGALQAVLLFLLDDLCFDRDDLLPTDYGLPPDIRQNLAVAGKFWDSVNASFRGLGIRPTGANSQDLWDRIFWDLGCQLRSFGTQEWFNLMAASMEDFSSSSVALRDGMTGPITDLESYIRIRCANSAAAVGSCMMEYLTGCMLPTQVRAHPNMEQLHQIYKEHASFLNDVFSVHSEHDFVAEDRPFNLITLLMANYNMSFPQGARRAIQLLEACKIRFANIETNLPIWEPDPVNSIARRYVQGLKEIMAGNFYWSVECHRYRSGASPFPELRQPSNLNVRITAIHAMRATSA